MAWVRLTVPAPVAPKLALAGVGALTQVVAAPRELQFVVAVSQLLFVAPVQTRFNVALPPRFTRLPVPVKYVGVLAAL